MKVSPTLLRAACYCNQWFLIFNDSILFNRSATFNIITRAPLLSQGHLDRFNRFVN